MSVAIDDKKLKEVALTRDEYRALVERLGREPNDVELGMAGVLWSEHCSYKTSKPLLRRLPTNGPSVLQGPGENAGVVDVGEGWAVAFKVESHNHPSAIEPYQGAATGVGGILRDVIAMGARPIAILDSLRFGPLAGSRRHFEGVVAGIAGYGNCMGIPTVGGEVYFEDCYAQNPLVNAMCVGLLRSDHLKRAAATGTGNSLMLVGAPTGRDGIHGASFASLELDDDVEERRPAVQVGNPFLEKCLLEACMELSSIEAVVAIQDLGAAGLTSSVAEAASRGASGAKIDVSRVPRRESGMSPYEVMLSESQERMLVVVARGREEEVRHVFDAWDLEAAVIGEVTDDGHLTVFDGGEQVARIPIQVLTEAPSRRADSAPPSEPRPLPLPPGGLAEVDLAEALLKLAGSPNLCSRRPVYRRYDHMVGDGTVIAPGGDAAVVRIKGTRRAVAMTIDGNGRYCRLDPFVGAQIAVAEAARNLAAVGARPLALTDCLNFGNPDRPEIYWQLEEAVAGITTACRAFDLPVVSGNVSLYNESETGGSIDPTPIIGMVGLLDDYSKRCDAALKDEGDFVLLVGTTGDDLGGSEFMKVIHDHVGGQPPRVDLAAERAVRAFVVDAIHSGLLRSAHDCAEGGMLVALAESCLLGNRGVRCPELRPDDGISLAAAFFAESQARFVVSAGSRAMPELQARARRHHVNIELLGNVHGDRLVFDGQLDLALSDLRQRWEHGLVPPSGVARPDLLEGHA